MGFCTASSLSNGFMICNPDLRSLATAVDNFLKNQRNETPIQEVGEVTQEEVSELCEAIDNWLGKSDRPFMVHFNYYEENYEDIEPAIFLCYSKGKSELIQWGRNASSTYEVIAESWADEEFIREAKEAFKQLGEDPVMKEAQIVPKMQWIQGLSVG